MAGVELINSAATCELLKNLLPFLKGVTLWYWATATWWIPMLLVLGIWRHRVRRFRFRYDRTSKLRLRKACLLYNLV